MSFFAFIPYFPDAANVVGKLATIASLKCLIFFERSAGLMPLTEFHSAVTF